MRLKLAARRSDLARLQAYLVGESIERAHPDVTIEYNFKESLGDINLTDPLWKAPEKGLFTEDFYADLTEKRADLVVHSWKDLPIVEKPLTYIAATLPRADARDMLLMKTSSKQKSHLTILSSSPRRNYNLTPFFQWSLPWKVESVQMESVRGNIPTRIRKLTEGPADGIIVAKAALDRLLEAQQAEFDEVKRQLHSFLQALDFQVIPHSVNPPCAGQGALAIEILRDNSQLAEILGHINCEQSRLEIEEERRILKGYGGGCHQKIGVWVRDQAFGRTRILKGVTDQGTVLDEAILEPKEKPPVFSAQEMASLFESSEQIRRPINCAEPTHKGWIVARAEALPSSWNTQGRIIWCAGLNTWRKLAQNGVWVHGSFDGFGEEEIRLSFLPQAPNWLKLTHSRASERKYPQLATYEVELPQVESLENRKFYFWRSPDHFEQVFSRFPQIAEAWHACGPGATYHSLLNKLKPNRVFAFLNESDWRRQCQR